MRMRLRDHEALREAESLSYMLGGDEARLLFVAPHDDDAVLGSGMLLRAARNEGLEAHVVVVTDGRMGYCRLEDRDDIVGIRRRETEAAMEALGGPYLHFLDYPDCDLDRHTGRRRALEPNPAAEGGHTGLQNSFTALLRRLTPTHVVVPTGADYHPDHQCVHRELLISLFHAYGTVWPELGTPLQGLPRLYESAVYCDFPAPPTVQLEGDAALFEAKLTALEAYTSQEQIAALVTGVRDAGPFEYFREAPFTLYDSRRHRHRFGE